MEKIAVLFSRFPKIDPDLKIDMHQVLKKMILYHFGDDLEKAKELLYLITVNFTDEEVDKMNSYEREIYAKDQEITRITEEKDQEITRITEEKDQEISRLSEELNELKKSNKSSS
jgi:DNA polymerase III delta prime subunit